MSPGPRLRVLIVGAGAVGQVFALHLQHGGAWIGLFVKPVHAEEARRGFRLLPTRGSALTLQADEVLTEVDEVAAGSWDQVWLCTSSPALRGRWLTTLLGATGTAVIVQLQPGLEDRALLLKQVIDARLLTGLIGFMAWKSPLPGQTREPEGLRYWFPPGSRSLFSGPGAELAGAMLTRGGCPARVVKSAGATSALGSAVLLTAMASLERAGWRFKAWRGGPEGRAGCAAGAEALAIAAALHDVRPGPLAWLTRWPVLSLVSRLAALVAPTDLEAYFHDHFKKVGLQTRAALADWIAEGTRRGLPTAALQALALPAPASTGAAPIP